MVCDVLSARHQLKVLNSIVELVAVAMMDDFMMTQSPSKTPFHHDSMFKPTMAADTDNSIAVDADMAAFIPRVIDSAEVERSPVSKASPVTKPMGQV